MAAAALCAEAGQLLAPEQGVYVRQTALAALAAVAQVGLTYEILVLCSCGWGPLRQQRM